MTEFDRISAPTPGPAPWPWGRPRLVREAVCAATAVLVSHYLMHFHFAAAIQLPFANLDDLIAFRTPRPFCYRVLSPAVLKLLTVVGLSPAAAANMLEWGALVALYYVYRSYLAEFVPAARSAVGALAVYAVLPFVFIIPQPLTVWYAWDVPSIIFFTVGLHALHRRRWVLWYVALALGTLNRETTVFLLPVFVAVFWPPREVLRHARHLAFSVALWGAVKLALAWVFRLREGAALAEWSHRARDLPHWRENLGHLADVAVWPYMLSLAGFVWILAWHLKGEVDSGFLRRALAVVPLYIAAVFLVGNMAEHRVYADLVPVVLTPVLVWALAPSAHAAARPPGGGPEAPSSGRN